MLNPQKVKLHEAAARASDAAAVMENIYSTLDGQVSKKIRSELKTVMDAVKVVSVKVGQGATSVESAYAHSRWESEKKHQEGPQLKGERKMLGNLTNYINDNDADRSKTPNKRERSNGEIPSSKKSRKASNRSPSSVPEAADGKKYTREELASIVSQSSKVSKTITSLIATGKCPVAKSTLYGMRSKLSQGIPVSALGKMGRPTIATISEVTSLIQEHTKDGNTLGEGYTFTLVNHDT